MERLKKGKRVILYVKRNTLTLIVLIIIVITASLLLTQILLALLEEHSIRTFYPKFRLIDGNTGVPIAFQKITVCDDSIKFDWVGNSSYTQFCDKQYRTIWGETTTDANGEFYFNVRGLYFLPNGISIVFDTANPQYSMNFVLVELSDSLGHTKSPNHLRVINSNATGYVNSNIIYNLDNYTAREIFADTTPERNFEYSVIEFKLFKKIN